LRDELESGTYQPGGYGSFIVHEPKRRKISAAPFRDRVVHHALMNVIGPPLERQFIFDSYANQVGKGTHRALNRCTYFMRRYYAYVLPCDVTQFFPSIDQAILRGILARTIKDEHVMSLIDKILASGEGILTDEYDMVYFSGDDLFSSLRPRGLPKVSHPRHDRRERWHGRGSDGSGFRGDMSGLHRRTVRFSLNLAL